MKKLLERLKKSNNKKGFTLIEIIVVLVILGILAAIAVPAVTGYIKEAKESQYIAEARSIYLVIQTEEARYEALADDQKTYADLYEVVKEKTNLTVTNINVTDPEGTTTLASSNYQAKTIEISWTSDDTSTQTATINRNKNVEITTE